MCRQSQSSRNFLYLTLSVGRGLGSWLGPTGTGSVRWRDPEAQEETGTTIFRGGSTPIKVLVCSITHVSLVSYSL